MSSMSQINLSQIEQEILAFWDKKKIFEKTLKKRSPKGDFVFYDGPPFATGTPHYGHIVASLMKDIVPRYWTMKGYRVERKWGWDCHGLPIENIVEEEMDIKNKKQIQEIGVDKFNEACRGKVLIYAEEWKKVIHRFGRWVDMKNDYRTMDKDFMESVWWVFKQLWDKGLIYEGYKSMHICPRCETTLSQSEVSQGYQDIEDISVIVKFELLSQPGVYVLAWTTTPWTLPGNVALAVGKHLKYVLVESDGEKYILVEQNADNIFGKGNYKILKNIEIQSLENEKYRPLFDYYLDRNLKNKENLYTIQLADFVTIEDGTGVVHIAPAFGEDDMNLGQEKKLPFIQHVKMDGCFTDEVVDFKGLEVKPKFNPSSADKKVLDYLERNGLVLKQIPFTHSYPHCWRCDSPLLNYAASSLFIRVTEMKEQLLKTAEKINWIPSHIKQGRFGKWLVGARDWSISRQRFWGSVIPVWVCGRCQKKKVFGAVKDLEKISGKKIKDLHKHFVDKIVFKCPECGGLMERIPDVLDCWFESGSMPYAQMHYPFKNKEKFERNFPAQFIAEGVDQTRAWFYYLHVLSNALKNSEAFRNVVANGIVLAEDGKKMSKRMQNYPDPMEIMEKYGADAIRYYLANSSVMKAEDLNFSEKDLREQSKFITILLNVLSFYQMFSSSLRSLKGNVRKNAAHVLDKWILSRINLLTKTITKGMDSYDLNIIREIPLFIDDLSTWYVRRSRDRFKNEDDKMGLAVLKDVLTTLSRLMAPFMPFIAEYLYRQLGGGKKSVHLENWPEFEDTLINEDFLSGMQTARKICELGHSLRTKAGIKVRQALSQLLIANCLLSEDLIKIIGDELNVNEVKIMKDLPRGNNWISSEQTEIKLALNIEITPELKRQGLARELVRQINSLRKRANLTRCDNVDLYWQSQSREINEILTRQKELFKKDTLVKNIFEMKIPEGVSIKTPFEIEGEKVEIGLKRI